MSVVQIDHRFSSWSQYLREKLLSCYCFFAPSFFISVKNKLAEKCSRLIFATISASIYSVAALSCYCVPGKGRNPSSCPSSRSGLEN